MNLPFLNPYIGATAPPDFRQGCNFAVAGSTVLPATATSVSPFAFGVQVAQFFRFRDRIADIQNKSTYTEENAKTFPLGVFPFSN